MTTIEETPKSDSMLTTMDNPHNPFTEYDKWWRFDFDKGYKTLELLASVAATSDELSEADEDLANEQAIQDVLDFDPIGIYIRLKPENAERILAALR